MPLVTISIYPIGVSIGNIIYNEDVIQLEKEIGKPTSEIKILKVTDGIAIRLHLQIYPYDKIVCEISDEISKLFMSTSTIKIIAVANIPPIRRKKTCFCGETQNLLCIFKDESRYVKCSNENHHTHNHSCLKHYDPKRYYL